MIELSTLTGAMVVSLAFTYSGLFCNDDKMSESLIKAGESGEELLWRMPLHKDYRDMVKGEASDLKNHAGPWGGCATAAAYLSHFVDKDVKWAHIDIAGPTGVFPNKNGTGYGV